MNGKKDDCNTNKGKEFPAIQGKTWYLNRDVHFFFLENIQYLNNSLLGK